MKLNHPAAAGLTRPGLAAVALALVAGLSAGAEPAARATRSATEIIAAAPDSHWRQPDPANLLFMQVNGGIVIIELAPRFAPGHVANIRTLARERFWNGASVYRVQDNYVAQFGDADSDDATKAKSLGSAKTKLPAEFHRDAKDLPFDRLPDRDGWAPESGFVDSFPAARDPRSGKAWLAHCYGTVGAARNNEPDSSTGAELYVVIGQAPRHLDDNITVVGRVLMGMEYLSGLKRGTEDGGMYATPEERVPIRTVVLGSEVPADVRPRIEVLRSDSSSFRDATEARRNRVDDFFKRPAGHIDLCNVPVPVRIPPAGP
jgi:peptidylprolyl isomerase